jgi:hypothetical protein
MFLIKQVINCFSSLHASEVIEEEKVETGKKKISVKKCWALLTIVYDVNYTTNKESKFTNLRLPKAR